MNHLNTQVFKVYQYGQTVNSYGVRELNSTDSRIIRANMIEKSVYADTGNVRSLISDHFMLTNDKNCHVNEVLVDGSGNQFIIVSVINTSRFAQITLKLIEKGAVPR